MKSKPLLSPASIILVILLSAMISSCKKNESNSDNNSSNHNPQASFTFTPTSGTVLTEFLFDASTCSDAEDTNYLLEVRWDWENDGIWDSDWSSNKVVNHKFDHDGDFTVVLEVKDTKGLKNSIKQVVKVALMNNNPTAIIKISPSSGTTSTNFEFDASNCYDNNDSITDLQVRWDFEGDGVWDTDWDIAKIDNHIYSDAGTYDVRLEVKNTLGFTDDTTQTILVDNSNVFIDPRDGKEYKIIHIGELDWFAENLNYNGDCYQMNQANCDVYGGLYELDDALQACPPGWHLASDDEWKILEGYADSQFGIGSPEWDKTGLRGHNAGKRLKSTTNWINNDGIDAYGFTALPGGYRNASGFYALGEKGYWWTSTSSWARIMKYDEDGIERIDAFYGWLLSVRCVRDHTE